MFCEGFTEVYYETQESLKMILEDFRGVNFET